MIHTESQLKDFKSGNYTFIYLYFKYKGKILRINTGNKPVKNGMTKELLFNSSVENYKLLNEETKVLKSKVDSYIKMKLSEFKGVINQKECIRYIDSPKEFTEVTPLPEKNVLYYFDEFIAFKQKELSENSNSLGNYHSLKLNLINFQTSTGNRLTFEYINTKGFIIDFKAYLNTCKANNSKGKYLNSSSVSIRLSYIKTFYKWLTDNDIYSIKPAVMKINTSRFHNEAMSLSKADLMQLQQLTGLKPNEQLVIDMFIANCLMGLRFSDLITLNQQNLMQHATGEYFIKQTNLKTDIEVIIELQPTSLNTFKKYNLQFPAMTLHTFNDTLNRILTNKNLFPELITIQQRENNSITDIQTQRRNLISSHTCRRTFVNLCLNNNVPINVLMKATGHRNINTLQNYIQPKTDKEAFRGIDLMIA